MASLGTSELSIPHSARILKESITSVAGALGIVTLPAILFGALSGYLQVGFKITPKAIELDPSKVDLVKGLQRLVSMRALVRTSMAALKVGLITIVVVAIAWSHLDEVIRMGTTELGPLLVGLGRIALRCAVGALVVILMLGFADLAFQRYQHSRDLRMSKQDLKEEFRLTEGDPHMRARIRQIQREMATRRMMSDVPEATVVVTNPTHFAVALRYDFGDPDSTYSSPVVVAKGVDHLAQQIKKVAVENAVLCYEDVPLARALHSQCEIGQQIPEELYAAVAVVLGYVYRLRGMTVTA
jgi:flagellar biosynthetic protein FlhB